MKVLLAGVDGYIGYALAQKLLLRGHSVYGVDAFYRRMNVKSEGLESIIPIASPQERKKALKELGDYDFVSFDISTHYEFLANIFENFQPEAIVNLAQLPSAAFSMKNPKNARWNINNNVCGDLNVLWAMRDYAPESSLVILGTMGIWGFPNVNIPEGFFQVEYEGQTDILPFPRQTSSVYHTSKAQASDLDWFAARVWELRITEVEQGVVYGTRTDTMTKPELRTRFDISETWGTYINRAVSCAVMGHPITPYGSGLQTRAYIQLRDSIDCLTLLTENHPTNDDSIHGYRVVNQFDENYNCNELADIVKEVGESEFGLNVEIENIPNPRVEPEYHYYNPKHEKLYKMGWQPKMTLKEGLKEMFEDLLPLKTKLEKYKDKILPKILWRPNHVAIKRGEK